MVTVLALVGPCLVEVGKRWHHSRVLAPPSARVGTVR